MFVAEGMSGVIPILHGIKIYSIEELQDRIGLNWILLEGLFYLVGAGLYAVSRLSTFSKKNLLTKLGSMARAVFAWNIRHLG